MGSPLRSVPFTMSSSRWKRDLLLVAAVTAATWWGSVHWEVAERLARIYSGVENLEIDEAPGVLLVFAVCLLWYAWRRFTEARRALERSLDAEQRLERALSDNRRLVRQYGDAQDRERAALSRELHDELGQYLLAIKTDAIAIKEMSDGAERIRETAGWIADHVDRVHASVANLIGRLRPVGLDELGIAAALEHCIDGWTLRRPSTPLDFTCTADVSRLADGASLALYRMVQEGLTNAFRHAAATRISITLSQEVSPPRIVLEICDDGVGFDSQTARTPGLGLMGMRERVEAIGGNVDIESAPRGGCRLVGSFPLDRDATGPR